jgi:hypothetical protein
MRNPREVVPMPEDVGQRHVDAAPDREHGDLLRALLVERYRPVPCPAPDRLNERAAASPKPSADRP